MPGTRGFCAWRDCIATTLGAIAVMAPAAAVEFDSLVQSRFVHCAFYRNYDTDPATGNLLLIEGKSDSLTHYQAIDSERARSIDTRMAGAREVRVLDTGKHLHFIDSVAGMYIVTTVYSCIERDERRGVCLTYGAVNARHFDSRVLLDPDRVFTELRDSSDPGFCDYSFVGVQEASRR
ncbi:MAG: hypothetical protein A3G24_04625 [Betaproteobacteria bacterium RIFCSPLOWO2_12_FULL_62_13]|nr:MAG: hypothetical protein A3G24_04625 [Betaproteobacteria bacterium RIFCSPLOWO2_12_FULL_62_13]